MEKPYWAAKKVIKAGDIYDEYCFERPLYRGGRKPTKWIYAYRHASGIEKLIILLNVIKNRKRYKESNVGRARKKIRTYVNANFNSYSKFVTLTTDQTNVAFKNLISANHYFHLFIKKLRRKYGDFKYVAVPEFHKSGFIHYHFISNLPFIKNEELRKIWGYGFVKINIIEKVDHIGAYVVKYLSKDLQKREKFNNYYLRSRNLKEPTVYYGEIARRVLMQANPELLRQYEFENEFTGKGLYRQFRGYTSVAKVLILGIISSLLISGTK